MCSYKEEPNSFILRGSSPMTTFSFELKRNGSFVSNLRGFSLFAAESIYGLILLAF